MNFIYVYFIFYESFGIHIVLPPDVSKTAPQITLIKQRYHFFKKNILARPTISPYILTQPLRYATFVDLIAFPKLNLISYFDIFIFIASCPSFPSVDNSTFIPQTCANSCFQIQNPTFIWCIISPTSVISTSRDIETKSTWFFQNTMI